MLLTDLHYILPEIFITVMACVILVYGVYFSRGIFRLTMFTLIAATVITLYYFPIMSQSIFDGSIIIDKLGSTFKILLYVILGLIFMYSRIYMQDRKFYTCEVFVLSLLSMLGMMIIISSSNFLSMYLGLELFVLPLYVLIVMVKRQNKYPEAAMKYFIIGSLGTGLLLFGISCIYGATGSFSFASVTGEISAPATLLLGIMFVIVGLALEFGAVPFHMWLPDVYEGSPTTVTMIIGTLPKLAIFAIIYRLMTLALVEHDLPISQVLLVLGVLSVGLGNLLGIAQSNLKRLLAYSTIGHIGFILLAILVAPTQGYVAAIFYTVVYVFMSLAAFAVILRLTSRGFEADKIEDFTGLGTTHPWLAFIMLLVMLSLAGLPPMVGFAAKLFVLQNLVAAGYNFLAVVALIFSVIGTYYYLRVIKLMYFCKQSEIVAIASRGISPLSSIILSGHGLLLLVFGVFPGIVLSLCVDMLK